MLSTILAKSDCAACKFCCSFRRTSLWETPIFSEADLSKLKELYPTAKFRPAENCGNSNNSYTFDISDQYKTNDPNEEALCPFLDPARGCSLPSELKPFDCKIWPLRVVSIPKQSESEPAQLAVALTPTCPAINKVPLQKVRDLAASGLGQKILDYAANHPDMVKEYSDFLSTIVYTNP